MSFNIKKSNMKLMRSIKNECIHLECSICYKKINKTYFICGEPCSKVFHIACIQKMMDQIEETAYDSIDDPDEEPNYRCCYCRRDIHYDNYMLQLFEHQFTILHGISYDAQDAIDRINHYIKTDDKKDQEETFKIYDLIDMSYIKQPKQPKRQFLIKNVLPRRIITKQNIGGRRR